MATGDEIKQRTVRAAFALFALTSCASGEVIGPAPELTGPSWIVTRIDGVAPIRPGSVTISFLPDGRFSGAAPCNAYGGRYEIEGAALSLDDIEMTLRACLDQAVSAEEIRFFNALDAVTRYGGDTAGGLALHAGDRVRIRARR